MTRTPTPKTVDAYIAAFPKGTQRLLRQLRAIIKSAAPDAQESISYRIPAYALHGRLVYFAAFKTHIGVYPVTKAVRQTFKKDLPAFQTAGAKSTLRFRLDRALPSNFIRRVVKVRIRENLDRSSAARRSSSRAGPLRRQ